ncbi:MAG: MarR family winged helix-turn-helix transcriptional regulator [Bacillota bacterium]
MKLQKQGGFLVAKIHQLAGRVFSRKLKEAKIIDLNPAQGRILFALWQGDNIPIQELAVRTALKKTTLTTMLDRLQEAGFIAKVPSPRDGRETLIQLTERNRHMKDQYAQVSSEMNDLFYQGFEDGEVELFEIQLRRILDNLIRVEHDVSQH